MQKLLLIYGGSRIGDTLHMLPYIYAHKNYEITWISGTYEKDAVEFIQQNYPNIVETKFIDDKLPMTIDDRIRFALSVKDSLSANYLKTFDKVENDIHISLDYADSKHQYYDPSVDYLPKVPFIDSSPYTCYHCDSISKWKYKNLDQYVFPGIPGYTIGKYHERGVTGTADKTCASMMGSATLIRNSILFIGIHSSMMCLNMYLNHPGLCIHFAKKLLRFSQYCNKIIDIM